MARHRLYTENTERITLRLPQDVMRTIRRRTIASNFDSAAAYCRELIIFAVSRRHVKTRGLKRGAGGQPQIPTPRALCQ